MSPKENEKEGEIGYNNVSFSFKLIRGKYKILL